MIRIADALRRVTVSMQRALAAGERSKAIDAEDLMQVLLAVADELDPPLRELVPETVACPNCGERSSDRLIWQDDELVQCFGCGNVYAP